jgi:hypothetical protein
MALTAILAFLLCLPPLMLATPANLAVTGGGYGRCACGPGGNGIV